MNKLIRVIGTVKPRSYREIDNIANNLLAKVCPKISLGEQVPIAELVDFDLRESIGYVLDVREDKDFRDNKIEAAAIFKENGEKELIIPERVFKNANDGMPRDRFTLAHEIGHLSLNHESGIPAYGSLRENREEVEAFRDPDWQANCFAGAFLIPSFMIEMLSNKLKRRLMTSDIANYFGVSHSAAETRLEKFRKYVNGHV